MDYICFYSKYSNKCKQLLDEFPFLHQKSVCVDNIQIREAARELKIVAVPTVAMTYRDRILERVVGTDEIEQWVYTTLYNLRNAAEQPVAEQQPSSTSYGPVNAQPSFTGGYPHEFSKEYPSQSASTQRQTSIHDIPFDEDMGSSPPKEKELTAMELAKRMQTAREQIDATQSGGDPRLASRSQHIVPSAPGRP